MERIVSDHTIRRFFGTVQEQAGSDWVAEAAQRLWAALPEALILDWDSTMQSKYGHQEGAAVGYNPQKPWRRSFHPLLAVAAGTRLCLSYQFRPGDTVTATQWSEAMEETQRWLGTRRVWFNRGDLGLGHERVLAWHEARPERPHYLFKLKLTANVRRAPCARGVAGERVAGTGAARRAPERGARTAPAGLEPHAARGSGPSSAGRGAGAEGGRILGQRAP